MRLIGNVEKDAQVRAVASGALPSGDAVVVNSDGTVSVVEETSFSESTGSPTVFEGAASNYISIAFDSSSNKIVIAYRDEGNSNYGTAIVGTVSGTSISFGTAVVFESASTEYIGATFDTNSNKVVLGYRDQGNSNRGTAIVGTVSGTSISFGSATVYDTNAVSEQAITFDTSSNKIVIAYKQGGSNSGRAIVGTVSGTSISFGSSAQFNASSADFTSAGFDTASNKVVISYKDDGNSSYGTSIVGTVSGTSISFGTKAVFESASTRYTSTVFDSANGKTVVAYADAGNSYHGTAVVGTVSGTSISFGSPVVFEAASVFSLSATYDVAAGKVTVAYQDDGNGQDGTLISGTVSGTSISFGSPAVFETDATNKIFSTFDSSSNKVVVAYAASSNGISVVHQNAYDETNLTSENFLGFAAHTYADTQSALVNSTCTVDRNQTSLTAGQKYYVQTDGSLGTTAADPSVVAGTAISSTEIIVKG